MLHSIEKISKRYSELSSKRNDRKLFRYDGFIEFAKNNEDKYSLIKSGDCLLVSTWYSSDLISDYRETL